MTNTLYLPELKEMLELNDAAEMREFCTALHPARTAEFMEGLSSTESWEVLRHADIATRAQIFSYFDLEKQVAIFESVGPEEMAELLSRLANDEGVDLLEHVDARIVDAVLARLPADERRVLLRLRGYPEDSAGSVMTTEFARLNEGFTVRRALEEVSRQAEGLETIYYLYVVDEEDHLRGIVSARQLVSAMGKPDQQIRDLMERDVISVDVDEELEEVTHKVADYDLLAIPVVDHEHRMLGIITHDDALDMAREEAVEDAQMQAAIDPLERGYMETGVLTLVWKRGIWLTVLFFGSLFTAVILGQYQDSIDAIRWMVMFLPLVVSSGGNSGNQSATLVITAMATAELDVRQWRRVLFREAMMGFLLGGSLGLYGFCVALLLAPNALAAAVVAITLLLVVTCGTLAGSMLPLLFRRLGLDPALMSNPMVAVLIDIVGIAIYVNVALLMMGPGSAAE